MTKENTPIGILSVAAGWAPIETAKMQGVRVIGWCKEWEECFVVKWSPWRPAPHWTTDDGAVTTHAPTHWQHLPSPPNTESRQPGP